MPTNLAIDDDLLKLAQDIGNKTTKKATVTEALEEYIARRKRLKALEAFCTLETNDSYDYKNDRKQR